MAKTIVIKAQSTWWHINLHELWEYRELLYILIWRDLKVRYKQTLLGILWVLIQPLVTTGIFSIFFGTIAKIPTNGLPYPIFIFAGLCIWNFFTSGVSAASNSVVSNQGLIQKIYFPRLIVVGSSIATVGVDFFVTLILLFVALFTFGYYPGFPGLLFLPVIFLILFLFISGCGMLAAALSIRFRDVRFLLPFALQLGLYISPIIYPLSVVTGYKKTLLMLNPMTGIIEAFRAIIQTKPVDTPLLALSFVLTLLIFTLGLWFFRNAETYFVDLV